MDVQQQLLLLLHTYFFGGSPAEACCCCDGDARHFDVTQLLLEGLFSVQPQCQQRSNTSTLHAAAQQQHAANAAELVIG
jgi:hypothetical protein